MIRKADEAEIVWLKMTALSMVVEKVPQVHTSAPSGWSNAGSVKKSSQCIGEVTVIAYVSAFNVRPLRN